MICDIIGLYMATYATALAQAATLPREQSTTILQGCDETLDMSSSAWSSVLESGRFHPNLESDHHLVRLRYQLQEMKSGVEYFQNRFSEAIFGKDFDTLEQELSHVRYSEMLPDASVQLWRQYSESAGQIDDISLLLDSYSVFQRLDVAVELARQPAATSSSSYLAPSADERDFLTRHMWRVLHREIKKVLQNVYTELLKLQRRGASTAADNSNWNAVLKPPLARSILPRHLRCIHHSAFRDTRDFAVLKAVKDVVGFYQHFFENHYNPEVE